MGVDYCRISLRPGVNPEDVMPLVESQAAGLSAEWAEDKTALNDFLTACDALENVITFHNTEHNAEEYRDSYRTLPVTGGYLFALEWQIAANRSYLPDDLPAQSKRWRDYLAEVARGWHRSYLLLAHYYQDWVFVQGIWEELHYLVREAQPRQNNWANRPELQSVIKVVLDMGAPPHMRAPRWIDWADTPDAPLGAESQAQCAEWLAYRARLEHGIRQWNSNVPGKHKIPLSRVGQLPEIDVWVPEELDDEYDNEFYAWVDDCCANHQGLYYWA